MTNINAVHADSNAAVSGKEMRSRYESYYTHGIAILYIMEESGEEKLNAENIMSDDFQEILFGYLLTNGRIDEFLEFAYRTRARYDAEKKYDIEWLFLSA
jgi:hypothetical protein